MYGKLFAQMYDGTLGTKGPWQALVAFQQLIILADVEGVVDMTADALSRRTTIPLDIIERGIAELERPDRDSRTPDEEGRRIVRLSADRAWGWRIVNYAKYRAIRTAEERRAYQRDYWLTKRSPSAKLNRLNNSTGTQPTQPIVEVEVEAEEEEEEEEEERAVGIGEVFSEPIYRAAYHGIRVTHRNPGALDASLTAQHSGLHPPAYDWPTIGRALSEMQSAGATFTPAALRGFCRRIARGDDTVDDEAARRRATTLKALEDVDATP